MEPRRTRKAYSMLLRCSCPHFAQLYLALLPVTTTHTHRGLEDLDIEYNSLTPKAATVLANSISFNEPLLKLNINGNILGKIGAQALVAAIQRSSTETRKLQVSFTNCDCTKVRSVYVCSVVLRCVLVTDAVVALGRFSYAFRVGTEEMVF
jgi:Ran GTPase-activating protein (RanGAP) involved in mRNA processing and transport